MEGDPNAPGPYTAQFYTVDARTVADTVAVDELTPELVGKAVAASPCMSARRCFARTLLCSSKTAWEMCRDRDPDTHVRS